LAGQQFFGSKAGTAGSMGEMDLSFDSYDIVAPVARQTIAA
jgi:hypothetical protein